MKFAAGAILLCLAGAASAQSAVLVGGGATLPAVGYAGDTTDRLMTPDAGSLLAAYNAANSVSSTYCQTGSGGGKNVLIGATRTGNTAPDAANIACVAPTPSTAPIGFGGTGTATAPNFVGSDSPLASAEFASYMASPAHTATASSPVQVPAVAGAVAIVFNKPEIAQLRLTEAQVCQIFSGQVTRWEQLPASSITLASGQSLTPGAMNIVYRSDGSGTSFAFTNHLSAKCGNAAGGNGVATAFQTNQAYATGAASYLASYASSTGASGNPAVVSTIVGAQGSIGYAETANSIQSGGQRALVQNDTTTAFEDPAAFGNPLTVSVVFDQVIGSTNDANGRPTLAALPSTPGVASCIALVNPSDYAVPSSGYPIVAVSYFLANAKGNGADAAHVRSLLLAPYTNAVKTATTKIGPNTGLSYLTASQITPALTARCVGA